jgi:hypothetical protein
MFKDQCITQHIIMSQQQELEKLQRPWGQPTVNRPPTPHPFIKPFYVKHQLNSTFSTTAMDVWARRVETQQPLSRVELLRSRHRKRRATTIRQLKSTQPTENSQTSVASEHPTNNSNNEEFDLPEVMEGLVLDEGVNRRMETTAPRCRLCGRFN